MPALDMCIVSLYDFALRRAERYSEGTAGSSTGVGSWVSEGKAAGALTLVGVEGTGVFFEFPPKAMTKTTAMKVRNYHF